MDCKRYSKCNTFFQWSELSFAKCVPNLEHGWFGESVAKISQRWSHYIWDTSVAFMVYLKVEMKSKFSNTMVGFNFLQHRQMKIIHGDQFWRGSIVAMPFRIGRWNNIGNFQYYNFNVFIYLIICNKNSIDVSNLSNKKKSVFL